MLALEMVSKPIVLGCEAVVSKDIPIGHSAEKASLADQTLCIGLGLCDEVVVEIDGNVPYVWRSLPITLARYRYTLAKYLSPWVTYLNSAYSKSLGAWCFKSQLWYVLHLQCYNDRKSRYDPIKTTLTVSHSSHP